MKNTASAKSVTASDYKAKFASDDPDYAVATEGTELKLAKAAIPATVTANNRTYDETEKPLVTVDNSTMGGGMMVYALGKDDKTAPDEGWGTSVPSATEAGTYYVWYKAIGDENHADSEPKCLTVTIAEPAQQQEEQKPAEQKPAEQKPEEQKPTEQKPTEQTQPQPEPLPEPQPQPAPAPAANPSGIPILTITSAGSDALNFALTNVSGVDGFDIFLTECGNKGEFPLLTSIDGTSATLSGFKVVEAYKAYAQPWVMVNGVKTSVLGATLVFHCFTDNGNKKMTNPGSLTLKKQALTIRLGKTASLKGTVKGVRKGKLINHDAKLRFISSNPAVATVSAKGKATITVTAANGKKAKVKIEVE